MKSVKRVLMKTVFPINLLNLPGNICPHTPDTNGTSHKDWAQETDLFQDLLTFLQWGRQHCPVGGIRITRNYNVEHIGNKLSFIISILHYNINQIYNNKKIYKIRLPVSIQWNSLNHNKQRPEILKLRKFCNFQNLNQWYS